MEPIPPSLLWLISVVVIISITITLVLTTTTKKQPPGPPKLPIIGNLHQLAMSSRRSPPHRLLADLAEVYGQIMHLQLGEVPTVVVSSADVAMEVMKTNDVACCSRPELMVAKEMFYNCTDIAFAPYGEYWRHVRKIATLELFTSKRVGSFRTIREEEVGNLVKHIGSQAGSVVNLSKLLFALAFDITTRIAFGKKGKDEEAFRALTMTLTKVTSGFSMVDFYPSSKLLYAISGMRKKLVEGIQEANKILDPIIEDHKFNKESDQDQDLVHVLLKFHQDNVQQSNFSLTTNNIKSIILELFGGGSDTSSTVLEWAMSHLIKNPMVMKKAQDEVRLIYQNNTMINESKLNELNYLKLVIKETLRLHPPLPLLVPRQTIETCQIQGYDIPIKTRIIVNAWAIARDPKYWSEPEHFIPERFQDSSLDFKGGHFEPMIPFGAGRRRCPGTTLGMANVELPLAMLLYHFDWKLPDKLPNELDIDEALGITVRRKNELLVIPTSYPWTLDQSL